MTRDRRDRRHAKALDQAARDHEARRLQIDGAEQALEDRDGPAARDHAARQAERERREINPYAERSIVARHDPDLQAALEDRHGPHPLGLAERAAWDTTAARELRTLDPELGSPDPALTREWTLREPPEVHAPQPDIGFDL